MVAYGVYWRVTGTPVFWVHQLIISVLGQQIMNLVFIMVLSSLPSRSTLICCLMPRRRQSTKYPQEYRPTVSLCKFLFLMNFYWFTGFSHNAPHSAKFPQVWFYCSSLQTAHTSQLWGTVTQRSRIQDLEPSSLSLSPHFTSSCLTLSFLICRTDHMTEHIWKNLWGLKELMRANYIIAYFQRASNQKMLSIVVAVVVNCPWQPSDTQDELF